MFDLSFGEVALVALVALIVIGPKELPAAMRVVGRGLGHMKRLASGMREAFDAMVAETGADEIKDTLNKDRKFITDQAGNLQEVFDISDFLKQDEKPKITADAAKEP